MKWIRWTALLPLAVTLVLIALAVYFYLDPAVRRGVEVTGTEAVGARVTSRPPTWLSATAPSRCAGSR